MDDEVKGKGNSVNYKYRMHDPRIGRFFAIDPLAAKYPHYTPYQFSGNKVIHMVELEGLEEDKPNYMYRNGTSVRFSHDKVDAIATNNGTFAFVGEVSTQEKYDALPKAYKDLLNVKSSDGSLYSYNKNGAQALAAMHRSNGNEGLAKTTEVLGGFQLAVTSRVEGIYNLITSPVQTMKKAQMSSIKKGVSIAYMAKRHNLSLFQAYSANFTLEKTRAYREGDLLGMSESMSGTLIDVSTSAYGGITSINKGFIPKTGAASGDAIFTLKYGSADKFLLNARNVKPISGYFDVSIHGNSTRFRVGSSHISHRTLAKMIQNHSNYRGQPIRLISCKTGCLSNGAAQNLANKMGVNVIAPNNTIWAHPNGRLTIGRSPFVNNGRFVGFSPNGK